MGGDEFVVYLEVDDPSQLQIIAQRIQRSILGIDLPIEGREKLGATIAFGHFREDESYPDLLHRIDDSLLESKEGTIKGKLITVPCPPQPEPHLPEAA